LCDFFLAWEHYDTDLLRRIFAKDATYEINGVVRFRGIEEIQDYWLENSAEQEKLSWSVIHFSESPKFIVASWRARFRRRDKRVWYSLAGLIWLEIRGGKIRHLRENFSKVSSKNP
jgi:hypothetical protein